jgi:hypothetical protein
VTAALTSLDEAQLLQRSHHLRARDARQLRHAQEQ